MLAWFGGTDKESKVGRALIAEGGTGRPRTEKVAPAGSSSPVPPRPQRQLLPLEAKLLTPDPPRGKPALSPGSSSDSPRHSAASLDCLQKGQQEDKETEIPQRNLTTSYETLSSDFDVPINSR